MSRRTPSPARQRPGGCRGSQSATIDGATCRFEDLQGGANGFAPRAGPEDLSLLLYTSGTTGRPKGVPRRHRAERAAALAHVAQNLYARGERTLGVMPLYHTMGVRSLLAMALVDGTFVCLPRFDAARALRLIARERISNLYLVPTLYHDLIGHPDFAATDTGSVEKDRLCRRGDAGRAAEAGRYGVPPGIVCQPLRLVRDLHLHGRTARRSEARLGRQGRTQPAYSSRPPRRRQTPTPEPCSGENGQIIADMRQRRGLRGLLAPPRRRCPRLRGGWYFTGDTGYVDAEGDLFVTGRVDDMIVCRRREHLTGRNRERSCRCTRRSPRWRSPGLPDERWGQRITAFVKRSGGIEADALDAWCRGSSLADYKRPREYVFVAEIPKSPVGKILRRLLVAGEFRRE